eukprot:13485329-Alexandrium_andersonii.AAC.1
MASADAATLKLPSCCWCAGSNGCKIDGRLRGAPMKKNRGPAPSPWNFSRGTSTTLLPSHACKRCTLATASAACLLLEHKPPH